MSTGSHLSSLAPQLLFSSRDDDGQYVVIYTSADAAELEALTGGATPRAGDRWPPPPASSCPWLAPSSARVLSSGYTFAPLLPEYDPARACGETLVTHVAKLDAGGVVGAWWMWGGDCGVVGLGGGSQAGWSGD